MRTQLLLTTVLTLASLASVSLSAPVSNPVPAPAAPSTTTDTVVARDHVPHTHDDLLHEVEKVAMILQVPPEELHKIFNIYPSSSSSNSISSTNDVKKAGEVRINEEEEEDGEEEDKSACSGLLKFVCKLFGKKSKPAGQSMQLGPLRPDTQPGMGNSVTITGGRR